jgi:predicted DNA-binding transcriptional regulator YafY
MSKRAYISRYLLIIKRLKAKPYSSKKDLEAYLEKQSERLQMRDEKFNMGLSGRTISRDIKDIKSIFEVDIEYSKKEKGYFIYQSEIDSMNFQRMMEAFDIFNSLNIAEDLTPFIHLEKRKPQGTENLFGLLHAIKNKLQIKFAYQKFWEDEISHRTAEPYALKEFKNRWYLMAKDGKDAPVKSFGLDRLSDLEITNQPFVFAVADNIEDNYRYCFGIISPDDEELQDIVLSFDRVQGKYIKSLPLHHTQQIIIDNEDELQVKLKLYITHDFVMELLSFSDNMKVLQPTSLAHIVRDYHKKAYLQYK